MASHFTELHWPLQRMAPHRNGSSSRSHSPGGDIAGAEDLLVDAAEVVAVGDGSDAVLGHLRTQQERSPSARQPVLQSAFRSRGVPVPALRCSALTVRPLGSMTCDAAMLNTRVATCTIRRRITISVNWWAAGSVRPAAGCAVPTTPAQRQQGALTSLSAAEQLAGHVTLKPRSLLPSGRGCRPPPEQDRAKRAPASMLSLSARHANAAHTRKPVEDSQHFK